MLKSSKLVTKSPTKRNLSQFEIAFRFFYVFLLYFCLMQKTIIFILLYLSIIFFFNGCLNKPNVEIESGPEIYLSQPVYNDTLINDSNLFLNLIVGDINGVHDVDISIYNENFSELNYNKFFDHIHDDFFELESNINISSFKKNKKYIILISANDMNGILNIDTTIIHVKN